MRTQYRLCCLLQVNKLVCGVRSESGELGQSELIPEGVAAGGLLTQ